MLDIRLEQTYQKKIKAREVISEHIKMPPNNEGVNLGHHKSVISAYII